MRRESDIDGLAIVITAACVVFFLYAVIGKLIGWY